MFSVFCFCVPFFFLHQSKFGRNFRVTESREEMSIRRDVKEKRCHLEEMPMKGHARDVR